MEIEEIDIARNDQDDLSLQSKQDEIIKRIERGDFDAVICTPPCSTWSRVRAANFRGPPPLRDFNYPWGYPWVKRKFQQELELGNVLVRFTIRVVETATARSTTFVLAEHPEDLGTVVREEDGAVIRPASIWQLEEIKRLVQKGLERVGINQCCWGTTWRKPTRLLTNAAAIKQWGPVGWPTFDDQGFYEGPLQQNCGCQVTTSLAKKSNQEAFRTTGTSIYPPKLDEAIADAIIQHCYTHVTCPPLVGEKRTGEVESEAVHVEKKRKQDGDEAKSGKVCLERKDLSKAEGEDQKVGRQMRTGKPMQCFYKGKHRTIHDGGGLCFSGRWPVAQRGELRNREGREVAAVIKSQFLKWLSESKVKWILGWIARKRLDGGATGRELKSALGRLSFVAGALQHIRPFLGPLFAWAAALALGTFSKFPEAVRSLLSLIEKEVERKPMSAPRRIPELAMEIFRVDAKAEKDLVVIGGWEVPEQGGTWEARWFSMQLTRRNAPWAFLKGEPFRNIASLELMAVLVAIIFFGEKMDRFRMRGAMRLSGTTDNCYVLQRLLSCKFPLSIVVMELACQLERLGLELDLAWAPRNQNVEADALTNSEFQGFDPNKRVKKELEEVKFVLLHELMEEAAEMNEELKLAKSSKEAKSDRPQQEEKIKKRKGQARWQDPW